MAGRGWGGGGTAPARGLGISERASERARERARERERERERERKRERERREREGGPDWSFAPLHARAAVSSRGFRSGSDRGGRRGGRSPRSDNHPASRFPRGGPRRATRGGPRLLPRPASRPPSRSARPPLEVLRLRPPFPHARDRPCARLGPAPLGPRRTEATERRYLP